MQKRIYVLAATMSLLFCSLTYPMSKNINSNLKKLESLSTERAINKWLDDDLGSSKNGKSPKHKKSSKNESSIIKELVSESKNKKSNEAKLHRFVNDTVCWLYEVKNHCLEKHSWPILTADCGYCHWVWVRYCHEAMTHLETCPELLKNYNNVVDNIDLLCENLLRSLYSK